MKRLEGTSRLSSSTRPPRGLGFGFYFGGLSLFCVCLVLGIFPSKSYKSGDPDMYCSKSKSTQ